MRASGDQHSGVVLNGGERRLGTGLLVALLAMLLSAVGAVTTAYAVDPPGKPTVSAPKTVAILTPATVGSAPPHGMPKLPG